MGTQRREMTLGEVGLREERKEGRKEGSSARGGASDSVKMTVRVRNQKCGLCGHHTYGYHRKAGRAAEYHHV